MPPAHDGLARSPQRQDAPSISIFCVLRRDNSEQTATPQAQMAPFRAQSHPRVITTSGRFAVLG
jgi:hypothetical protein